MNLIFRISSFNVSYRSKCNSRQVWYGKCFVKNIFILCVRNNLSKMQFDT